MKNLITAIIAFLLLDTLLYAQPTPAYQPFLKVGPLESADFVSYGRSIACGKTSAGADILIGSPFLGSYSFSSPPGNVSGYIFQSGEIFKDTGVSSFADTVVSLGDINSDGIVDYATGDIFTNTVQIAKSVSASTYTKITISESVLPGSQNGSEFGAAISPVGSFIAVGSPRYTNGSFSDGAVSLFDRDGNLRITCPGNLDLGDEFGTSLDWISDLDGDSFPDLIVGAPAANSENGMVEVLSVGEMINESKCTRIFINLNSGQFDSIGKSVAAVGDVNQDGKEDFIAGGNSDVPDGKVILFSGADGSILCDIAGASGEFLGTSVSALGDIDFDGKPEFLAGARGANSGFGVVYIFNYAPLTSNPNPMSSCPKMFTISGPDGYLGFGNRVNSSFRKDQQCDIDQDGITEFIVSSRDGAAGSDRGAVYAFSFPSPTPTQTPTPTSTPTATATFTATPVSTATPTARPTKTPELNVPQRSRFNFRITEGGNFVGSNTFDSKNIRKNKKSKLNLQNCKVSLIARYSNKDLSSVSPTYTIAYSKIAQLTTRFNAKSLSKVIKDPLSEQHYILHVRAKNVCGSNIFYSNVASRYLNCGLEPAIPVDSYIQTLNTKIR